METKKKEQNTKAEAETFAATVKGMNRDDQLMETGENVTATTILTMYLRLMQLTGGFLTADESTRPKQVNTAKLDALADIVDDYVVDAGKKLVIFARFRAEIAAIENLLRLRKIQYGSIYGDVPMEERGKIVEDFQTNPDTKVFVAQIQTAGLGITLHAASTAVFYSYDYCNRRF